MTQSRKWALNFVSEFPRMDTDRLCDVIDPTARQIFFNPSHEDLSAPVVGKIFFAWILSRHEWMCGFDLNMIHPQSLILSQLRKGCISPGPHNPSNKNGIPTGMRNHRAGVVEDDHLNPFVFDEQYNTFHRYAA